MRASAAALAAVLIALSGCAKTLDRPVRPIAVQPPEQWTGVPETPSETVPEIEGPREGDWWEYFGDSGLDRAVSQTLTRNRTITAAAARIDAAAAQARIAGAAELPEAQLSLQRGRQRQNFIGLPIPGREDSVLSTTNTNAGLSFALSWEADVWGRVKSGKLAALADREAAQADLAGVRLSLTAQTSKAWFAAIEANRQVQLARATLESLKVSAERVRARYESGVRPSLDLRLALTEVDRAEALRQQRLAQRDAALRVLEELAGEYPDGDYAIAEDLPKPPPGVPAGLPSELVHRRPDLIAAERRLLASDARIEQAQAELRPRFSLTSSTGTTSNRLQELLDTDVLVWSLIGGVTQPLFNNGRLKANVQLNEAQAQEAAASYEAAILQAYREVETALAAESLLAEREKALDSATRQALAAQGLAEQRYRAGLTGIITLLEAQRTALDSESELLVVRRARLDNRIDLHLALGGGFRVSTPSLIDAADTADERQKL